MLNSVVVIRTNFSGKKCNAIWARDLGGFYNISERQYKEREFNVTDPMEETK